MQSTMAESVGAFGQILRSERERRGLSLERLCAETKVNSRHLAALEEGDYKDLPGGVFRRGIVRAYLHALGLEESEWMPRFQASHASYVQASGEKLETQDEAWARFALNVKKGRGQVVNRTGLRWLGVFALLLLLLAAAWAVWRFILMKRVGAG